MLTKIKAGCKVQLYPGDSEKKIAKIISISDIGFEFEILEGTNSSYYNIGDIIFINHSKPLSFKLI